MEYGSQFRFNIFNELKEKGMVNEISMGSPLIKTMAVYDKRTDIIFENVFLKFGSSCFYVGIVIDYKFYCLEKEEILAFDWPVRWKSQRMSRKIRQLGILD